MDGRAACAVLGVGEHADGEEIRRAFRAVAKCTHPDHGGDRATFEEAVRAFQSLAHRCVRPNARPRRDPYRTMLVSLDHYASLGWEPDLPAPASAPPRFEDVLARELARIAAA